jgi:transcriptional regulator with XRE-family HTH domain
LSDPEHLGALLQRLRERKGITRKQMAEHLGMADTRPWELEGRYSSCSPRMLERILDFYEVSTEERLLAYKLRSDATPRPRRGREGGEDTGDPDSVETVEGDVPVATKGVA